MLLPIGFILWLFWRWQAGSRDVLIACVRMTLQLLMIGYLLVYLFAASHVVVSLLVLSFMLLVAGWIALRPVRQQTGLLLSAVFALGIAVVLHLGLSLLLVVKVEPWYQANVFIPLAGMYIANSMNGISLTAERFYAELEHGNTLLQARNSAFRAAMLPQVNGLLAVGLVALPGMMTGQILSGVSPLVAVRYQIMIMTMLLGTTAMASAVMLVIMVRRKQTQN